jgi:hypothetical protein
MNNINETKKIIPYKTSTGLEIGKFYERKEIGCCSRDMDLIQFAFIKDPLESKFYWGEAMFNAIVVFCFIAIVYLLIVD